MIERVARAVYEKAIYGARYSNVGWNAEHPKVKGDYYKYARAAIEAMMEPTKEMKKAGAAGASYEFVENIWQAMIREALKDG